MSKGKIIAAVVALLVVAGIVAGVMSSSANSGTKVSTAKVSRQTLDVLVTASGKVEAADRTDVFAPTAGTLDTVSVKDGQTVKEGDVLATMDTTPLSLQVAAAQAQLKGAQAQLDAVNRGVPAAIDRAAATAGVTVAQTGYDVAKKAYDTLKSVYDLSPPPVQASMEVTLTTLLINKQSAYAGLLNAKSGSGKLTTAGRVAAARAAARAAADSAYTSLAYAQDTLFAATLTAPSDGVVIFNALGTPGADGTFPTAAHGSAVGPQSAVFTVVQLGNLNFNAQVDEADIAKIEPGMLGTVSLDAFPSSTTPIEGKVVRVKTVAIQTTTGGIAFPVLLSMTAPDKKLLLGMSGSVDIKVKAATGATTVPNEAIYDASGNNYVFVIANGKATKRQVTIGEVTDTRTQILSGVDVGTTVATTGLSTLTDGAAVRTQ